MLNVVVVVVVVGMIGLPVSHDVLVTEDEFVKQVVCSLLDFIVCFVFDVFQEHLRSVSDQ